MLPCFNTLLVHYWINQQFIEDMLAQVTDE